MTLFLSESNEKHTTLLKYIVSKPDVFIHCLRMVFEKSTPSFFDMKYDCTVETEIPLKYNTGFVDARIRYTGKSISSDLYNSGDVLIEAKTSFKDISEVMRQIKAYQSQLTSEYVNRLAVLFLYSKAGLYSARNAHSGECTYYSMNNSHEAWRLTDSDIKYLLSQKIKLVVYDESSQELGVFYEHEGDVYVTTFDQSCSEKFELVERD